MHALKRTDYCSLSLFEINYLPSQIRRKWILLYIQLMPYRRKFCRVYLYGKMCSENEAGKQTAFLPSMFPYAHVRYRLKGGEFAKRPRVWGRRSVNSCDWRKYLAGEGRVIAKMNATRIQMMLFWAKPISNRFFLFFSVSVLLNSFPWLTINVFFLWLTGLT